MPARLASQGIGGSGSHIDCTLAVNKHAAQIAALLQAMAE